jgi:hypothetical protein
MGLPIKTSLAVFEGEPTKLLLTVAKRVMELRNESHDSGDEFDPVKYVTGAARNRGWGVYNSDMGAVLVGINGLSDEESRSVRALIKEKPETVASYLAAAAADHEEKKQTA